MVRLQGAVMKCCYGVHFRALSFKVGYPKSTMPSTSVVGAAPVGNKPNNKPDIHLNPDTYSLNYHALQPIPGPTWNDVIQLSRCAASSLRSARASSKCRCALSSCVASTNVCASLLSRLPRASSNWPMASASYNRHEGSKHRASRVSMACQTL